MKDDRVGDARTADEQDLELSALIDGELSERDAALLEARIARDPLLAERLACLERVDSALRALPVARSSGRMPDVLRARVLAEPSTDAGMGAPRPWVAGAGRRIGSAALLAAAAAAAIAYWTLTPPASDLSAQDVLARASEEELGIAFDYDTLADLELIEELELLELLLAIDAAERS